MPRQRGPESEEARQRRLAARLTRTVTLYLRRYLGQVPVPPPWRSGTLQGHIHARRIARILSRIAARAAPLVDFEHVHEHSGSETDGSVVSAASTVSEEDYDPFADYPAPQQ